MSQAKSTGPLLQRHSLKMLLFFKFKHSIKFRATWLRARWLSSDLTVNPYANPNGFITFQSFSLFWVLETGLFLHLRGLTFDCCSLTFDVLSASWRYTICKFRGDAYLLHTELMVMNFRRPVQMERNTESTSFKLVTKHAASMWITTEGSTSCI